MSDPPPNRAATVPRLSGPQFAGVLAVAVAWFLVGEGPVWVDPTDYRRLLPAIGWSYALIPPLVAACLLWSRRLGWAALVVSTIEVAMVKFGLTATFMLALWLWVGPGPGPVPPAARPGRLPRAAADRVAPEPTPLDPGRLGTIEGRVVDASGAPATGALAWISSGLDGVTFAAPARPTVLEATGGGFMPLVSVHQEWQPFVAWSLDGRLHALRATDDGGRVAFTIPVLAPANARPRVPTNGRGILRLSCTVHPVEPTAYLLVTPHPFGALTDSNGSFHFAGVPEGSVGVSAWAPAAARVTTDVVVSAGQVSPVVLTLPPPDP